VETNKGNYISIGLMAEVQNYADSYARRDLHVYEIPILENLPTVYKVVQVNTYDRWKTEKMK
jgi:hypothetical protein